MKKKGKNKDTNAVSMVFLFNLIYNRIENQGRKIKQGQTGINTSEKEDNNPSVRRVFYIRWADGWIGKGIELIKQLTNSGQTKPLLIVN